VNGIREGEGFESIDKGEQLYQGNWSNDMKNGFGKETVCDLDGSHTNPANFSENKEDLVRTIYEGEWKNNKKHG